MYILGLNINHADTSSAIFRDNQLIAAAEEERFTRIKHYALFPFNSIKFCLSTANISLSDVNYVTINSNPFNSALRKIYYTISNPFSFKLALSILNNYQKKL